MRKKFFASLTILPLIASMLFANISIVSGEEEAVTTAPYRDVFSDTWVATDALGRVTPMSGEVREPQEKKVGVFYFLWHNNDSKNPIFDHTKAFSEGGMDAVWDMMSKGPLGYAHYWAEPYFGYYRTDDEWVIRKHTTQLVNAGIDFVYFDVSNGQMYQAQLMKILKIWDQIRKDGGTTPQFMFLCGDRTDFGKTDMTSAYNTIYKKGLYKDLWFMWDNKPLIFGNFNLVSDEMKANFSIKRSWAFTKDSWYTDVKGKDRWAWADLAPQNPGLSANGTVEQMIVSCGFWANGSNGRSFTNGQQPTDGKSDFEFTLESTPLGLAFDEQWTRALEVDPPLIMITGWNEWWAGRWGGPEQKADNPARGQKIANTYVVDANDPVKSHYFVDNFNTEFSRDVEPMKGGFGDNYYYQMVNWIRKYKGVRELPVSTEKATINMTGGFAQWDGISLEYRDNLNDTNVRKANSNGGKLTYTNESGRNNFDLAKVSRDSENVYFLAKTREAITAAEGTNWMNLYIDIDQKFATGWCGYDYVLNRSTDGTTVSIEKFVDNSWNFEKVGDAEFVLEGNQLMIKASLSVLGLTDKQTFDFKWADNSTTTGEPMQFMDLGDSAPDDRFNFRYSEVAASAYVSPAEQAVLDKAAKDEKVSNIIIYSSIIGGAVILVGLAITVIVVLRKK